jgi:hypothetical protein
MYNLLSVISNTPERPDIRRLIRLLKSDIKKRYKNTFTSNALRHGEHVYHDRQVVDAFTRAGYKLESYDDDDIRWEPMNEVKQPSTMSVDLN